jgi:transcriptional regulator with XRE-family HTH domain
LDRVRIGTDIRTARSVMGQSIEATGAACGLSPSLVSRIERGVHVHASADSIIRLGAAVGLDVRLRGYPGPDPALDTGQLRLIGRLAARLSPSVRLRTEVPIPIAGDQRAWDGLVTGFPDGPDLPVEADTRMVDVQAQTRRMALKRRDAGIDHVVGLLADTDRNRAAIAAARASLAAEFPVTPRRALAALAQGRHPGGSAVILL